MKMNFSIRTLLMCLAVTFSVSNPAVFATSGGEDWKAIAISAEKARVAGNFATAAGESVAALRALQGHRVSVNDPVLETLFCDTNCLILDLHDPAAQSSFSKWELAIALKEWGNRSVPYQLALNDMAVSCLGRGENYKKYVDEAFGLARELGGSSEQGPLLERWTRRRLQHSVERQNDIINKFKLDQQQRSHRIP